MTRSVVLKPSLWRTCRVLANRRRLQIFGYLVRHPGCTVTELAAGLGVSVSMASQYLRALDARGLASPLRRGGWVAYRSGRNREAHPFAPLADAVHRVLRRKTLSDAEIFRAATAFTHERRILLFRLLLASPMTVAQLRRSSGISFDAIRRHLQKLGNRGFIRRIDKRYEANCPRNPLAKTLVRLVAERI